MKKSLRRHRTGSLCIIWRSAGGRTKGGAAGTEMKALNLAPCNIPQKNNTVSSFCWRTERVRSSGDNDDPALNKLHDKLENSIWHHLFKNAISSPNLLADVENVTEAIMWFSGRPRVPDLLQREGGRKSAETEWALVEGRGRQGEMRGKQTR